MNFLSNLVLAALLAGLLGGCGSGGGGSDPIFLEQENIEGTTSVVTGGALGDLTDLGDLEGDAGPNWLYTETVDINDAGQIVGHSLTAPAAFIWDPGTGMKRLGIHIDFATDDDRFYDNYYGSGTKPFVYSEAVAVNNHGWAIGNSNTGVKDAEGEFTEKRAFLSNGLDFYDIAPITDTGGVKSFSEAVAINDNGYVVLTVEDGDNGTRHAYYWDGVSTVAAAPDGTEVPRLGRLSGIFGEQSEAVALNQNNEAVVNSGDQAVYTNINTGFSQRVGKYLNDSTARATDINDKAQIVGISGNLGFFWEAGAMTRISSLGGETCEPVAINNLSQVAGNAATASGAIHAFRWQIVNGRPQMTDLGTLGGVNSYATGINDAGHIVGYSEVPQTFQDETGSYLVHHAFYWANGKMYDLGVHNDFYDYSFIEAYPFSKAVGINAGGTVAGNSTTPNQNSRGFTLTPTAFP